MLPSRIMHISEKSKDLEKLHFRVGIINEQSITTSLQIIRFQAFKDFIKNKNEIIVFSKT